MATTLGRAISPARRPWRGGAWRFALDQGALVVSVVLALALWVLGSVLTGDPRVLPMPTVVVADIWRNFTREDLNGYLAWYHIWRTLVRILVGFSAASVFGVAVGLAMGVSRFSEKVFGSYVTVLLSIPGFCWVLLCVLWLGISEETAYVTIFLSVFPFVAVNIWEGVRAVDKDLVEMAAVYRTRRSQYLRDVYLPHLMPYIFSAVRYAFAMAWKVVVLVELFGLQAGVGAMMSFWYESFRMDQVLAWVATFGLVVGAAELLVVRPLRSRVFRWSASP